MAFERHLILQDTILRPSGEWTPSPQGWTLVRVAEGAGYWLQVGGARAVNVGDGFAVAGPSRLLLRASQLGPLKLEFFCVHPQFLNGLITVTEGHQLEQAVKSATVQIIPFAAADAIGQKFSRLAAQPQRESLATRSALLQLWSQAVTGVLHLPPASDHGLKLRERFHHLIAQMPDAELATRPLAELAEQLHCSERHFSRLFREEFGVSLRTRQTELRLLRARQLLADGRAKIINVAYESGYRHLGLFNAMFKKRFGVTPSEWRQQNFPVPPKNLFKRAAGALIMVTALLELFLAPAALALTPDTPAQAQARAALMQKMAALEPVPASVPAAPARTNGLVLPVPPFRPTRKRNPSTNAGPVFAVDKYLVSGNTILKPGEIGQVITNAPDAFGTNVSIADIREALGDLQLAYRERGFVTVSVGLPPQKLTNATVKVKVTEGRLAAITVKGNEHYSTANVMRALPSLHTNMLLNSHVFQRELDQANANRNRQIYPVIGPGPEPSTSELTLKVKDRLPLHAHVEINNQTPPGTPDSRVVFNGQYDNLWQLEHQLGANYSFSPVNYKAHDDYVVSPLDQPLVANYGAYYRMPLGSPQPVQQQVDNSSGAFGYNEATHQFRLPPPSGRAELNLYANRSVSDTGVQYGPRSTVTDTVLLKVDSQDSGENLTLNEGLGGKFSLPLPPLEEVASTFSVGLDFKRYRNTSYNTNNFYAQVTVVDPVSLQTNYISQNLASGQPVRYTAVDYFPINFGITSSRADASGNTLFNAQLNYNLATHNGSLAQMAYSAAAPFYNSNAVNKARNNYVTVQAGLTREQRLYKDWTVLLRADGQWASCPLFSNEQYAMGGAAGVRGYMDGQAYGDTGWRVSIEPRTPMYNIGMVDGDILFWVRASVFLDYGETYLLEGFYSKYASYGGLPVGNFASRKDTLRFCGTGWSLTANIGSRMDGRLTMGMPLLNTGEVPGWNPVRNAQFSFGIGVQF